MAQFGRPDSDVTTNTWAPSTGVTLFGVIDESSASDVDFVSNNNNTNDGCEVGLSNVTDPVSSTGHVVRYRYAKDAAGGNARNVTVSLYQGGTLVAEQTHSGISETFTAGSFTLTGGQADAITDYTDLRVRLTASGTTGGAGGNRRAVRVSWVELEVPDAPAGSNHSRTPADGVGAADARSLHPTKKRADSAAVADAAVAAPTFDRRADGPVVASDSFSRTVAYQRTVADGVGAADVADPQLGGGTGHEQPVNDTATATDALALSRGVGVADGAAATDAVAFARELGIADGVGAGDAVATGRSVHVADSAATADVADPQLNAGGVHHTKQIDDTATAADALAFGRTVEIADDATAVDSATTAAGYSRTVADGATVADSATAGVQHTRQIDDAVGAGDSVSRTVAYGRLIADDATLTDDLARSIAVVRMVADAITADDDTTTELNAIGTYLDPIPTGRIGASLAGTLAGSESGAAGIAVGGVIAETLQEV